MVNENFACQVFTAVVCSIFLSCILFEPKCHALQQDKAKLREVKTNSALTENIQPGELHTFSVQLKAGRNHIQLKELGVDLVFNILIDGTVHAIDTPTGRFSFEQLWLDVPRDQEATARVTTYDARGAPGGQYRLTVRSDYTPSAEERRAEELTNTAIAIYSATEKSGLALEERKRLQITASNAYAEAADAWETIGKPENAGYCWQAAAFIESYVLRQQATAQKFMKHAAENWRQSGNLAHEAFALKDIGQALRRQQKWQAASNQLEASANFIDDSDLRLVYVAAVAENDLCLIDTELGRFIEARQHCQVAASGFERISDTYEHNKVLHNRARIMRYEGNYEGAIDLLRAVSNHQAEIENIKGQAQTLSVLSEYLIETGDLVGALASYDEALPVFKESGMVRWQATLLTKYAKIEQILGRHDEARHHLRRAFQLAFQSNDLKWQTLTAASYAEVDLQTGNGAQAIQTLNTALDIFRENENSDATVLTLASLVNAHLTLQETDQAKIALSKLKISTNLQTVGLEKIELLEARILLQEDKPQQALELANSYVQFSIAQGNLPGQLEAGDLASTALIKLGRWHDAHELLESLRDPMRTMGQLLVLPEFKSRFYAQQLNYYRKLIESSNKIAESDSSLLATKIINIIEESRAAELMAHLESNTKELLAKAPPELRRQYDRSRLKVSALIQPSLLENSANNSKLTEELHLLERLQNRIWQSDTNLATLNRTSEISQSNLMKMLDAETAILYFSVTNGDPYYYWIDNQTIDRIAITLSEPLAHLTQDVVKEYRDPNSLSGMRSTSAKTLSEAFFVPVAERLKGKKHLLIVPDGPLYYLPFAGLPLPGKNAPLITMVEVSFVPSLRAAFQYNTVTAGNNLPTIGGVGDPVTDSRDSRLGQNSNEHTTALTRLGGTGRELDVLERTFGKYMTVHLEGFAANKSILYSDQLTGIDILHIGAHGIANNQKGERSGVFLSTYDQKGQEIDGHIGPTDLFGLNLSAQLVVLSGCETALGEFSLLEGPIGLARAFQYAGVPTVVSTLWAIDDDANVALMEPFYSGIANGHTVARSMRLAQLAMLESTDHSHPYYWAAIRSSGNWDLKWEKYNAFDTINNENSSSQQGNK